MLSDIFRPACIKMNLEGTTRDEVFEELVDIIAVSEPKYKRQKMLEAVITRENKMNTVIFPGIAVPHGYYSGVSGVIGAIGFSREGVEQDYPGKTPVHLYFMLLMDDKSREHHLQVFIRLLNLIKSPAFEELRRKGNPEDLYNLISRY